MTELSELFADVAPDIQQSIRDLGWHTPTAVQAAAIPKMRAGGDLIVQAMTGSGKTGAFGIPLVEAVDTSLKTTQAIVLLPTRELANQVAVELDQLGQYRGVNTLPIYGGVAYGPQLEGIEKGAHIIVGTPGRILDHLKNGRMDLSETKVFVLDEADEMLSLGFWPDMKEIAAYLPKKRQSHLFSATMPEKVRSLSRFFLNDPEDITIEAEGGPQMIDHFYYVCAAAEKESLLVRILKYEDPESAIIFCNTKADVRFITAYLSKRGFNIDQISGDLQQSAREKAIKKIKTGKLRFLVATDVAARGIDISDLAYVINYTTSDTPEIYVHRTGRTGRAGKSGVAISLISGLDIGNFKFMQTVIGMKIEEKKAPTERQLARRLEKRSAEKTEKAAGDEKEAELNELKTRARSDLAAIPEDDAKARVERIRPLVKALSENAEGLEELSRVAAAYLLSGPKAPAVAEPKVEEDSEPGVETREEEIARMDREAGKDPEERPARRRSRTGRSGGGSGDGRGGSRGGSSGSGSGGGSRGGSGGSGSGGGGRRRR
jgi:ATP-dependent RNA helicase DeaD